MGEIESILTSIKKMLGYEEEFEEYDIDIMVHINSSFNTLTQLGAGPEDGFEIENELAKWSDFTTNKKIINKVKQYVYMNVKLIFDPPLSSWVADSMKSIIAESEWRIRTAVENGGDNTNVGI